MNCNFETFHNTWPSTSQWFWLTVLGVFLVFEYRARRRHDAREAAKTAQTPKEGADGA